MIKSYKLFYTEACPNCPSVKEHMKAVTLDGQEIDATTGQGMEEAGKFSIMTVPTVVFVNDNNEEVSRASTIEEIKRITENKTLI
jgi:glutaredoxin